MMSDAFKEAVARCGSERIIPVVTSDESLSWIIFRFPNVDLLSQYAFQASQPSGPLWAAAGLARALTISSSSDLESVITNKPFVVMRAIQVVLKETGLATVAEKKSP